jgi:hypothetical protein
VLALKVRAGVRMLNNKQTEHLYETLMNIDKSLHLLKDAIVALNQRVAELENDK